MKLKNCTLDEALEAFKNRKIIIFGIGGWYNVIQYTVLRNLKDSFSFAIDNKQNVKSVTFIDKELTVFPPSKLQNEKNAIVLLTSPNYMYDMYMELEAMDLDDSVLCYAFPFMQMITPTQKNPELEKIVANPNRTQLIPKILHSFWFSGEPKPDSYKKCIDTWAEKCPDYKIIEWNKNNYDFEKNPFCKRAIECGSWAFASDYARLDVVYQMGGIYLDMDVELLHSLDSFLGNKAIFPFYTTCAIDLAFFGAEKELPVLSNLLRLYDNINPLPEKRADFAKFFQPGYVAKVFFDAGVHLNGSLQCVDGMVFFPKCYFMPLNLITFEMTDKNDYTRAIHHANFGWKSARSKSLDKKISDNKKLWNLISCN